MQWLLRQQWCSCLLETFSLEHTSEALRSSFYIFFSLIPCSKLSFGSHPFFTWLFIPVVRILLCLTVLLVSRLAAQDHWLRFVSWQRWRSEPTLRRAWYFSPSFVAFWECTLEVLTLFHQLEVFACLMVLAFRMLMNPVCLKDTEKKLSLCRGCSLSNGPWRWSYRMCQGVALILACSPVSPSEIVWRSERGKKVFGVLS